MHRNVHPVLWPVLLLFFTLSACGGKDESQVIRIMIDRAAGLAENHQVGEMMQLAADDFIALPGNYTNKSVQGILFSIFEQYGRFEILYPLPSVELAEQKNRAAAGIYFMIMSKDRSIPGLKELYDDPRQWLEAVGEKADLYQMRLDLIKMKGDWRVKQAHVERFKGWGF